MENDNLNIVEISSKDKIGRMLDPNNYHMFTTWLGKCNSIRSYIDAITIPGYDINLLKKPHLTKEEVKKCNLLGKKKVKPKYYEELVLLALYHKVITDKELYKALKELPENTVFGKVAKINLTNEKVKLSVLPSLTTVSNTTSDYYIKLCNKLLDMVKNGEIENPAVVFEKYFNTKGKITTNVPLEINLELDDAISGDENTKFNYGLFSIK